MNMRSIFTIIDPARKKIPIGLRNIHIDVGSGSTHFPKFADTARLIPSDRAGSERRGMQESLAADDVHVWQCFVAGWPEQDRCGLLASLSPAERTRCAAFHFEKDRT